MKQKNTHFLSALPIVLAVVGSLSFTYSQAWAQDNGGLTNIAALPTKSDLILGQDKPGPYTLSWNKLPPVTLYKPTVVIDDKVVPETAYTWDAEKGTISFTTPLKSASAAKVTYSYDPASSERNTSPTSAPITIPMLRAGSTQLQLTALPGGLVKSKNENDPLLVWRLSGTPMNALGGKVTTQAALAPNALTENGGESGLWDRSGLSVGYQMGTASSGLEASLSRAGREFAPTVGKTLQMGDTAAQTMNLAARYSVAPWLHAEWKQTGTDYLADKAGEADLQVLSFRIGGTANLPTLNLTRTEDDRTDGTGVTNGKKTDRLELAAKIGPQVALNGTAQTVETDAAGKTADKSTTVDLKILAQSSDKTQAASVAVTGLSSEAGVTERDKTGVAVTLQPSPSVTITAEQKKDATTTTGKDGDSTVENAQSSAQAKIALAPGASVTGGVSVKSSADPKTQSEVQATSVTAKLGEGKGVELAQVIVSRAGSATGTATLDTTDTRLSLRPVRGLLLSGALVNNPEKDGLITEAVRQEMGITAKVGSFSLGSGYALTELAAKNGQQQGEFSVSLGLRFNRYTLLSGEYKDGLMWGVAEGAQAVARGLRVYTLGLTHDLGSALNFSLGGQMTQDKTPGSAPSIYEAKAKLGVSF